MAKIFYTELDIEELVKKGQRELFVDDNVVLTDLAREKAIKLGMQLVRENDTPPSAPVRPYISKLVSPAKPRTTIPASPRLSHTPPEFSPPPAPRPATQSDIHARVRSAVLQKLGDQVDHNLLDAIIKRVLDQVS